MGKRKQICTCGNRMRGENIPGSIQKRWICEGVRDGWVKSITQGCSNVLITCVRCKNLVSELEIYEERNLCMDCADKCHICNNIYYFEDFNKSEEGYQICDKCGIDCFHCDKRYYDRSKMVRHKAKVLYTTSNIFSCNDCYYYHERWIMKYFTVALECNHLIPRIIIAIMIDQR